MFPPTAAPRRRSRAALATATRACDSKGMTDLRWPTYGLRNVTLEAAQPDGEGGSMHVVDSDGNVYLDAMTGVGCAPLGHAHPLWVEAIERQMRRLSTAANSIFIASWRWWLPHMTPIQRF